MKVCLVTGVFPPQRCGIGDYTECLARHLAQQGVDVHVVTSCHHAESEPLIFRLHRVVPHWRMLGIIRLIPTLRRIAPDVVHMQYPSAGFVRALALVLVPGLLRLARLRVVLTLHEYRISRWTGRLRQLAMACAAHRVITTNDDDHACLRSMLFWKRKHLHHIGIGANIEPGMLENFNRDSRRQTLGADPHSLVICFFGNIHPAKGIEDLVDAFTIICKTVANTRLVIIGSSDPANTLFASSLRRKIIDACLADKVHISGFVSKQEVSELLLASDMCVLPFRDGISMRRGSFLAAVKHGLPVVTTLSDSAPPSHLVDGENVVFVSPGDVEKLAESIQMLAQSPEVYVKLKKNVAVLGEQFSWAEIARQTLQVYQGVCTLPSEREGAA